MSTAYNSSNILSLSNLKIYKNRKNQLDYNIKVVNQKQVIGKIIDYDIKNLKEICSYQEATSFIFRTSLKNWILGWLEKYFIIFYKARFVSELDNLSQ